MGEDKIELVLQIQAKGASGVVNEVKRVTGTFDELQSTISEMAATTGNWGGSAKKQIASLIPTLQKVQAEAEKTGQVLTKISVAGIGTKTTRVRAGFGASQTVASEGAMRDLANRMNGMFDIRRAAQYSRMRDRANLMNLSYDRNQTSQYGAMRDQANMMNVVYDKRQAEKARQNQAAQIRQQQEARRHMFMTGATTAGFIGLNVAQAVGGMFDSVKITGMVAPNISKIAEAIGGLFGQTFGKVFGELGNAIGRMFETMFDAAFGILRIAAKGISGLLTGMFISLISFNWLTGLIGIIGGVIDAVINMVKQAITEIVSIVKGIFDVIGSIISAGFTIIKGIISASVDVITKIWTSLWEGLKGIAEISIAVINKGLEQLGQGFASFVEKQKLSAIAFNQVADVAENAGMTVTQGAEKISKGIDKIRMTYGLGLADVGKGFYEILSTGFRTQEEAMKVADAAAQSSIVTGGKFAETTQALTRIMNGFGASANDAQDYVKSMTAAINLGAMNAQEYMDAIQNVTASAQDFGMSFDQLNQTLAATTLRGLNVHKVAIGLNRIFEGLLNPTKAASKEMRKLGIDFKEAFTKGGVEGLVEAIGKVPEGARRALFGGERGTRVGRRMIGGIDVYKGVLKDWEGLKKSFGKTATGMGAIWDTLINRLTQGWMIIREKLAGPIFAPLTKYFQDLLKYVNSFVDALDSNEVKSFFEGWGKWISPILDEVFNPLMGIFETFQNYLKQGDWNKFWDTPIMKTIQEWIIWLIKQIKEIPSWIGVAIEKIKTGFEVVKGFVGDLFNPEQFVDNFNIIVTFLTTAIGKIGIFVYDNMVDIFDLLGKAFMATFGPYVETGLKDIISKVSKVLSGAFFGIAESAAKRNLRGGEINVVEYRANEAMMELGNMLGKTFEGLSGITKPSGERNDIQRRNTFETMQNVMAGGNVPMELYQSMGRRGYDKKNFERLQFGGYESFLGEGEQKVKNESFLDTLLNDILNTQYKAYESIRGSFLQSIIKSQQQQNLSTFTEGVQGFGGRVGERASVLAGGLAEAYDKAKADWQSRQTTALETISIDTKDQVNYLAQILQEAKTAALARESLKNILGERAKERIESLRSWAPDLGVKIPMESIHEL